MYHVRRFSFVNVCAMLICFSLCTCADGVSMCVFGCKKVVRVCKSIVRHKAARGKKKEAKISALRTTSLAISAGLHTNAAYIINSIQRSNSFVIYLFDLLGNILQTAADIPVFFLTLRLFIFCSR
jgi:hypothetical protein